MAKFSWLLKQRIGLAAWEVLLLLASLVLILLSTNRTPVLHDEPDWIQQSRSLELFLAGDFSNPYWDVQHDTLTQPPLSRYMIGLGRRLGGYRPEDLESLERFYQGDPTYIIDPNLIGWSRAPMVILAVVTTLILFWLVRRCAGRLAAFLFLGLFLLNPSMAGWLIVAQSEMPLLFFVVLAMLAAVLALEAWQKLPVAVDLTIGQTNRTLFWLGVVGAAGGLAAAAKLNGFAAALAGSGLGVLLVLLDRRPIAARLRFQFAIRAAILPVLIGLLFMIAFNPFLYSEPFARIGQMLIYRTYEMNWQANTWPEYSVPGGWDRLPFMLRRVFQDFSALRFAWAWVLNLGLFLVGAVRLSVDSWRWLRGPGSARQRSAAAGTALLVVGALVSLPMFTTTVDWNRYYLFPVLFSSIGMALGARVMLSRLQKWWLARAPIGAKAV